MANPDIENRFSFHPADQEKGELHEELRDVCKEVAYTIERVVPTGREQALALTNLEQAMMWGNAGIARVDGEGARLLPGAPDTSVVAGGDDASDPPPAAGTTSAAGDNPQPTAAGSSGEEAAAPA